MQQHSKEIQNIKKPLISVIVPIYNVKKYLSECVRSICSQTYENLEIILVDDGSTDGCGEICDEWKAIDPRIRVIHKSNAGLGEARNSGMKIATGEYYGFVDSDDVISPYMYDYLMKGILEKNVEISACTRVEIKESDRLDNLVLDVSEYKTDYEVFSGRVATKELLQSHRKFKNAVWEKLYKRELFDNIKFKSVYAEDREIMYKLLYGCDRVSYINIPLYGYRIRDGSIMLSNWNDHKDESVYEQDVQCLNFFRVKGDRELMDAAIYWHILLGIENYRRLQGQPRKYKDRLKKEMQPYAKILFLIKTDYPLIRKIEFWIFARFPELHFQICNGVRWLKAKGW